MPTLYGALGSPFVRKAIVALTEKGIAYDHDPVVPFGNAEYPAAGRDEWPRQ